MSDAEETRHAPALRFVGVDRQRFVIAPAGMGDVVLATAQRTLHPGVEQVEHQRRMHRDRRLQAVGRLPSAEAHTRDKLANPSGRLQRHRNAIAGQQIALRRQPREFDLQALQR